MELIQHSPHLRDAHLQIMQTHAASRRQLGHDGSTHCTERGKDRAMSLCTASSSVSDAPTPSDLRRYPSPTVRPVWAHATHSHIPYSPPGHPHWRHNTYGTVPTVRRTNMSRCNVMQCAVSSPPTKLGSTYRRYCSVAYRISIWPLLSIRCRLHSRVPAHLERNYQLHVSVAAPPDPCTCVIK